MTFRLVRALCWCLAGVSTAACVSDPVAASAAYVRSGDRYFEQGRFPEAVIEYRNAVERAPQAARAYYKLAEAYTALDEPQSALNAYIRAADIEPKLVDAQLKAARLLLFAGEYEDARTRARAVLGIEPRNPTALVVLGNALAGLRSFDEAMAANQRAIDLDPTLADLRVNMGSLHYIQGNQREAEAAFRSAVEINPESVEARVGLGSFLWLADRNQEAEDQFRRALDIDPTHVEAHRALAAFYIATARAPRAERHLRTVVERSSTPQARYALADYYVTNNRPDDALAVLRALDEEQPATSTARLKMARVSLLVGRRDEATTLIDQILDDHPNDGPALAFKARLLLDRGFKADALATAKAAVMAAPGSAQTHFALGSVARAMGRLDDARRAFGEVLRIDPRATGAQIELAQLHLAARQLDTALEYAEAAVRYNPGDLEPQVVLVRVLAERPEERGRAAEILRLLAERFGASPRLFIELGRLANARGDSRGASEAFSRALELDPGATEPLVHLVSMDLRAGRQTEARRRIDRAVAAHPRSVDLLVVAARAYLPIDRAIAEQHLRRVIQLDSANIDAYQMLGALYWSQGKLADAKAEFIKLATQQPKLVEAPTMIGVLSNIEGDTADAERWYEKALEINPRAPVAANNLAWMYAEKNVNLEIAMQLAQIASNELPDNPDVKDTLGWVYFKRGMWAFSIRALQDAVMMNPKNPVYHYHLGLAHARNAEDARARISLETALKIDPRFPGATDARRVLLTLLY